MLAVGGREAEAGTVALRRLGSDKQEIISLDEVMVMLADEAMAPDLKRAKT
ncbi:MAG: His/Gly/Thr/Pro-type tRNA ligase C-terminal domain-containing protein [Candidatus Puniceispirillaceae bacterium]